MFKAGVERLEPSGRVCRGTGHTGGKHVQRGRPRQNHTRPCRCVIKDRRLRGKRTHRVPEQEQRQAAMLRTQRRPKLDDVADQTFETSRAKVAQSTIRGAPVPTMIDGVNQESSCIECLRKAVIAFTMLGESVGDLYHSRRCACHVSPGVGDDLGAVCVRDEGGG